MEFREVGKTGIMASIIGLGGEHLDGKPYAQVEETISAVMDSGMNIIDVFMPGRTVRENIAKAMGSRRKDMLIQGHFGSTDINQQYDISRDMPSVKRYAEEFLRIFGYIDFGMLFFIDSEADYKGVFETGFAEYVQKLKKQGDVHHIGFSSHNPVMAAKVIETGIAEMMLFSINLAFDLCPAEVDSLSGLNQGFDTAAFRGLDPTRAALYKLCEQKGVGITVMKTLGAGKLLSPEHTPFQKPMTAAQCIQYALSRPAVSSVLLGARTAAEVAEAMGYFEASEAERDYTPVMHTMRNDFKGNCVYCSHCQPCPAQIDIAAVNKYLDIAQLDTGNVPPSVRSHYAGLGQGGKDCIGCGSCESRCPFGVPIMRNMAAATEIFG